MYYSSRIVNSGLTLCLDAANKLSYIGSGTTWKDLINNNNSTYDKTKIIYYIYKVCLH